MIVKDNTVRSKAWLAAVHTIDCCVLCGNYGIQAAHRNEGKGMGMKASDCSVAAICPACHTEIDSGAHLSRDERRARMDKAIVLTHEALVKSGAITVSKLKEIRNG